MNKEGSVIRKSKFWVYEIRTRWGTSTVHINYNPCVLYYNLWDLVDELLEVEEISDELFKKIGQVLAKKIWTPGGSRRFIDDILGDKNEQKRACRMEAKGFNNCSGL